MCGSPRGCRRSRGTAAGSRPGRPCGPRTATGDSGFSNTLSLPEVLGQGWQASKLASPMTPDECATEEKRLLARTDELAALTAALAAAPFSWAEHEALKERCTSTSLIWPTFGSNA